MLTTQTLIEIGSREYGVIHAEIIEVNQSEPVAEMERQERYSWC